MPADFHKVPLSIDDRLLSQLLSRALREMRADAAGQLERQNGTHDESSEALIGLLHQIDAVLKRVGSVDQKPDIGQDLASLHLERTNDLW
jgi:hypothetical protein